MNAVREPHALEVTLEGRKIHFGLVVGVIEIELLTRAADTEVVTSVLVIEDVSSPEGCLGKAVNERFLLKGQLVKLRYVVTEDLEVIELIHVVLERGFFLLAATKKACCQKN